MSEHVKVRFCPSPTGLMHLGNTRTALFNALYALKNKGVFLLRIEDTDHSRSTDEYAVKMQEDLQWLGLVWNEGPEQDGGQGPYYQSQRQTIYDHYYQVLIDKKLAYPCFCSDEQLALNRKIQRSLGKPPRYPGTCLHLTEDQIAAKRLEGIKPTLRFHVPKGQAIEFVDGVKGQQRFNSDDIGDFIIRRADHTASFLFCNAIDDALMGVTHVIRGEDHLTNTPRQLLILSALDFTKPSYAHISLIMGPDGSPLSKRNGSKSVDDLRQQGFLPLAIINYLARLGHFYSDNQFMALSQLANAFEMVHLSRSPARFDENQLHFWQHEALSKIEDSNLWNWVGKTVQNLVPLDKKQLFLNTIRPNITFPHDALKWATVFFTELSYQPSSIEILNQAGKRFFETALEAVNQDIIDFASLSHYIKERTGKKGKSLFQPLRVALTGELHGPEMSEIVILLGMEKVQQRLLQASKI